MKKTNKDVAKLFKQIIISTSNKFDPNDAEHTEMINNLVAYLCRFGSDFAYEVLANYQYISTGSFFEWAKILEILKSKLASKYLNIEEAYKQMIRLTGLFHTAFETPTGADELVQQTIDRLGGWAAVGSHTNSKVLENSFKDTYSKVLENVIAEEMAKNAN